MKKIFIAVIVLFGVLTSGSVYAHEHKPDTVKMSVSDSLMQLEMAQHQEMEAVNAFPNYHPLIVHFPIVLLLMAVLFQILSFFFFRKEFSVATLILLGLGLFTAWLSANTFHAMPGELTGKAKEIFDTHEQMANFTLWFSFAALLIKITSHFFLKGKWWMEVLGTLLLIGSGIAVSIAGHHGSMLVHMEGIGPMGRYLDSYKFPRKIVDTISQTIPNTKIDDTKKEDNSGEQEEDHHVGELGSGPHRGTIEEADPFHMEIVAEGRDLIFYLLDGDARPLDMTNVTGIVRLNYNNKTKATIGLMEMSGKLHAMKAITGVPFKALCTLTLNGKSYTASFDSRTDLPID